MSLKSQHKILCDTWCEVDDFARTKLLSYTLPHFVLPRWRVGRQFIFRLRSVIFIAFYLCVCTCMCTEVFVHGQQTAWPFHAHVSHLFQVNSLTFFFCFRPEGQYLSAQRQRLATVSFPAYRWFCVLVYLIRNGGSLGWLINTWNDKLSLRDGVEKIIPVEL